MVYFSGTTFSSAIGRADIVLVQESHRNDADVARLNETLSTLGEIFSFLRGSVLDTCCCYTTSRAGGLLVFVSNQILTRLSAPSVCDIVVPGRALTITMVHRSAVLVVANLHVYDKGTQDDYYIFSQTIGRMDPNLRTCALL